MLTIHALFSHSLRCLKAVTMQVFFLDCFIALFLSIITFPVMAQSDLENATAHYFKTIQNNPKKLSDFLYRMPKGGDLHNHLGGATLAENLLSYAKYDPLCVDIKTGEIKADISCLLPQYYLARFFDQIYNNEIYKDEDLKIPLVNIEPHSPLWESLIDHWSMRHYDIQHRLGHDHFFSTFYKFDLLFDLHEAQVTREIMERAASQNELYLELMVTPDYLQITTLAKKVGWNDNFSQLRERLLANGLNRILVDIRNQLDQNEAKISICPKLLGDVKVRYLYQVLREAPPEQVFAQLLVGFALASEDPRVVGINMVQPEDGILAMRDYSLHMKMVAFLRSMYPKVGVSLHAGELVSGIVSPKGLRFHMREAVIMAHADRIGHGVDIRHEQNFEQLLNYMAKKHIMVEINLTSNEKILGIKGKTHPILLYLRHGVPVALSTDDEGVLRTNLTEEYKKAALTYHFDYPLLKKLSRNSIMYSFLSGHALWMDFRYQQVISPCIHDKLGDESPSSTCQAFLEVNEKARLQWELEKKFNIFEKHYVRYVTL